MKPIEIVITDCDHANVDIEAEIFRRGGHGFRLCQCETARDAIRECAGARALINQYTPLDKTFFEAVPTVKFVIRYGVGVDNINLADASACGVQVCNVPDYGMNEVADQAFAMMMALLRKLPQCNREVHNGIWDYRRSIPIRRMGDLTVGVLGLGRIGCEFARRLQAFNCRVIGCDIRYADEGFNPLGFVTPVSFGQLLKESDVISVHCSLNEGTQHLFDEKAFKAMKPSAYFVNVARGGIVDEAGLEKALREKWIAGAGLDVLEKEPMPENHFLKKYDNVILSPHIAWYSEEAAREMKRKCAEEAVAFLQGRPPRYPVNQPDWEAAQ